MTVTARTLDWLNWFQKQTSLSNPLTWALTLGVMCACCCLQDLSSRSTALQHSLSVPTSC